MKPLEIHRSFLGGSEYGIDLPYSETPCELRIPCNQKRDDGPSLKLAWTNQLVTFYWKNLEGSGSANSNGGIDQS